MRNIKFCIFLCLIGLSKVASAGCTANGCEYNATDKLSNIYLTSYADGRIFLPVTVGSSSLDCTPPEGGFLTLKSTHPLFKEMYSTILFAIASNKKLYVRIVNGSPICEVGYVRVYN